MGDENVRCLAIPDVPDGAGRGRFHARSKLKFGGRVLWEAARWRPDLTICTHLALGPLGWAVACVGRCPYWIVLHGIEAWYVLKGWKRRALHRADRYIVTSAFSREQVMHRHRLNRTRISTLPCTLDETLVKLEPAKAGVSSGISPGRRIVLTVARMAAWERYKGHDVVLHALPQVVANVPNLTYVMVGNGDDRPRLECLARELGLSSNVVFTGEVTDSELADLYRRSEAFVLPARTVIDEFHPKGEGFGIVFLEAMAFGKPVIGPNYGAPAELIREGKFGFLVDPEDPKAVSGAMLRLLSAPQESRIMGESASRWVREEYSFGALCHRLRVLLIESGSFDHILQDPAGVMASNGPNHGASSGGKV
jgi:glycosyltransferase involved in cell wall biosynthesis